MATWMGSGQSRYGWWAWPVHWPPECRAPVSLSPASPPGGGRVAGGGGRDGGTGERAGERERGSEREDEVEVGRARAGGTTRLQRARTNVSCWVGPVPRCRLVNETSLLSDTIQATAASRDIPTAEENVSVRFSPDVTPEDI